MDINGAKETPSLQYRGHRLRDGGIEINYELILKNGQRVKVSERPEYVESATEMPGLSRTFQVSNLPKGASLHYKNNVSSIAITSSIQTDGSYEVTSKEDRAIGNISGLDVEGVLTLNGNGGTTLTTYFTKEPLVENANKI